MARHPEPRYLLSQVAWHNYVVTQTVASTRKQVPRNARAVGVDPTADPIVLVFQMSEVTDADSDDIDSITRELEMYLWGEAGVAVVVRTVEDLVVQPDEPVFWIYLER